MGDQQVKDLKDAIEILITHVKMLGCKAVIVVEYNDACGDCSGTIDIITEEPNNNDIEILDMLGVAAYQVEEGNMIRDQKN